MQKKLEPVTGITNQKSITAKHSGTRQYGTSRYEEKKWNEATTEYGLFITYQH